MAQTATKKKARVKTEPKAQTKAKAKELKRIAKSCVGRRITAANPYATPSTWSGEITACRAAGTNSLWFNIDCDEEDGHSIRTRDIVTGITGKLTQHSDGSTGIAGEISRATIAPPAK